METLIIQTFTAIIGTAGFALIFHIRHKFMFLAVAGGLIGWLVFSVFNNIFTPKSLFISNLMAGLICALYSEIMARLLKAPASIFSLPAVIPLIPGAMLYRCMINIVNSNEKLASDYGKAAFVTALGLTLGMSGVWAVFDLGKKVKNHLDKFS
ncbi:Uncharacterized membrane protein YjjB, DUF3815 family [Acetitomaculum ruminis DSM 5522]|uniref:Uncharacterized membrane protein YjjB, DUF3815 family n=1 Tax=Acetitomaculum ruminis DSM 5522 TaxID=1120918 RepID=A0A1I0WNP5_9FIRM|nr:threonine/serine exporter family protein [Acetitomaculum ruminis]SFA89790.1 Uncharacterized membrane protein YjjB, DUF3815 family [Acetitomaculum ruminis DSM 5522]